MGLKMQFQKIAEKVETTGEVLRVHSIEASFGSINRSDVTSVSIRPAQGGYLLVAETDYKPSVAFWIIVVITLFGTGIFWFIPIIFYLMQKKTVQTAIEECFKRMKNEFNQQETSRAPQPARIPPPPGRRTYRIASNGEDLGDMPIATVKQMLNAGKLTSQDYYFDPNANEWISLDCLPDD